MRAGKRYRYIGLLLMCLFCFGFMTQPVMAQKSKSRSQLERQRKAARQQIEETSKMLKETDSSVSHQLNELNILNSEIRTRQALLATMRRELDEMEREQRALQQTIVGLKVHVKEKQDKYAAAMRHLYKWRSGYEEILFVLSAGDMMECARRMRYLHQYGAWRKQQAEALNHERRQTEAAEANLQKKKEEHEALLADQKREQVNLQQKQGRKQQLLTGLNKKKKQLQTELNRQRQQADALDDAIQRLIEEEARKAALEAKKRAAAANAKKKGAASTQTPQEEVMSEQDRKLSGTFAQNKGKMPYPVNGSYAVIGHFGTQQHSEMKYVQTINNGIILQTKAGTEACAIFDGEVNTVLQMPGYNTSVIVSHGQYYSVYNNLSKVYVKKGQKVKMYDAIGLIYTDTSAGNLTKMDFQIWKGTQKQNPETWLRR